MCAALCLLTSQASNQHSQAPLLNELYHVIFSWAPPFQNVSQNKILWQKVKNDDMHRLFRSNSAASLNRRGCVFVGSNIFDFLSGSEIVKSDVGNQYWNGRTTGHYNGKSHLAWDLVFTILLSRRPHGPMQNLAFWKQELNPP